MISNNYNVVLKDGNDPGIVVMDKKEQVNKFETMTGLKNKFMGL